MKSIDIVRESSLKNKKNRAITLIALVITIIVLLILAGVTVATLTGENGLLSKAATARQRTEEAEQDEKDKLSSYEDEIDNYGTWERTGNSGNTVMISEDEYDLLRNNFIYGNEVDLVVGKWKNEKNVYKKTLSVASLNIAKGTDGWVQNLDDWDIDMVVRIEGLLEDSNSYKMYAPNNNVYMNVENHNSAKWLYVWCNAATATISKVTATIYYTKTTDTAPSAQTGN